MQLYDHTYICVSFMALIQIPSAWLLKSVTHVEKINIPFLLMQASIPKNPLSEPEEIILIIYIFIVYLCHFLPLNPLENCNVYILSVFFKTSHSLPLYILPLNLVAHQFALWQYDSVTLRVCFAAHIWINCMLRVRLDTREVLIRGPLVLGRYF